MFDKDLAYKQFVRKIYRKKRIVNWTIYKYAAAVLLLISIAVGSFKLGHKQITSQFSDITIESPLGSNTKLYLPDGTLVWLNSGSKISYSQGFGVESRDLKLTGEGYFEVVKNEKLIFTVNTREIGVDVLGTKFNFRNYPEDKEAWVSLIEGKVGLENLSDNRKYYLKQDQKAVYNKETGEMRIITTESQKTSRWKDGYLYFDEELLPVIIKELERSYHVKIIVDEKLLGLRFYCEFERSNASIEEVINLLCQTNKMSYTIDGKTIILK